MIKSRVELKNILCINIVWILKSSSTEWSIILNSSMNGYCTVWIICLKGCYCTWVSIGEFQCLIGFSMLMALGKKLSLSLEVHALTDLKCLPEATVEKGGDWMWGDLDDVVSSADLVEGGNVLKGRAVSSRWFFVASSLPSAELSYLQLSSQHSWLRCCPVQVLFCTTVKSQCFPILKFCHSPWALATSDLLAVHLNDHISPHHCQWYILLDLSMSLLSSLSSMSGNS